MKKTRVSLRLDPDDLRLIESLKGELTLSDFVRMTVREYGKKETKETKEFMKVLQTIHANIDFLVVRIRALEAIENALAEILRILQKQGDNPGSLTQEDKKIIANLIWLLGQADNQKGWSVIEQTARNKPELRQWIIQNAK